MQIETKNKLSPDTTSTKLLMGVGIVALLVGAIWLGVQAAQFGTTITSGLASSFSGTRSLFSNDEDIVLVAKPGIVASEESFILSWEMLGEKMEGTYTFVYVCSEDVYFTSPASTKMGAVVFCNTSFKIEDDTKTLELTPILTTEETIDVTLQINFTPDDEKEASASGETTVTIVSDPSLIADIAGVATTTDETSVPDENITPTPPSTQGETTVIVGGNTTPVNDPNGTPDLTLEILEIGTVTTGGTFTKQSEPLDPDDRLAVKFVVENIGTKDTGTWRFEANLPTEPRQTYRSPQQETLLPGTRVQYTIGFENTEDDEDEITVRIELDEDNDVDELNENNNIRSITFEVQN